MLRFAVVVMLALLCGAAPTPPRTPAVSIVAFYRERMMLPAGASLHVNLTDVNTGHVLAKAMLDNPHVPVHLDLAYEPSNIDTAHVYTVTARILVDDDPFFATETPAKVITQGNPSQLELLLIRVTPESRAFIEDRRWTLWELNGHALSVERRPNLELSAGRVSGSGGCNRFSGGYKLDGNAIEFMPAAATMMMCIHEDVMQTESTFLKTLSSVRYWKAADSDLLFLDSNHKTLMRFGRHD
jgi:putative lipoprotein